MFNFSYECKMFGIYFFLIVLIQKSASNKLRQEQIKIFKEVVLRKLDMIEPPKVAYPKHLSRALDDQRAQLPSQFSEKDLNSYSGKLFLDGTKLSRKGYEYEFDLRGLTTAQNVLSATLNTHDNANFANMKKETAKVTLIHDGIKRTRRDLGLLPVESRKKARRLDITGPILDLQERQHGRDKIILKIACDANPHCLMNAEPVLEIAYTQQFTRFRRRVQRCRHGECCLRKFKVSIKDLGWGNWLLAPQQLTISYCKGSCKGASQTLLTQFLSLAKGKSKTPREGCCMPTQMKDLDVMHSVGNNTAYIKRLENLLVTECGCF